MKKITDRSVIKRRLIIFPEKSRFSADATAGKINNVHFVYSI
jgi:hypothetical protein